MKEKKKKKEKRKLRKKRNERTDSFLLIVLFLLLFFFSSSSFRSQRSTGEREIERASKRDPRENRRDLGRIGEEESSATGLRQSTGRETEIWERKERIEQKL
jgi:hypothetical protein